MLPVVVRVENLENKAVVQHVFRRSPIHIGRNKLNELALSEGFVSLWHGIVRFGENTLEYLDLDSTNGTEVDGNRLRRNVFVPVGEQTDLRIGCLRLHFLRREVATSEPRGDQTLFRRSISSQGIAARSTALQTAGTVAFEPTAGRTAVSTAIGRALEEEQSPGALASSLFLFYEKYREAWRTLHAQLTSKLAPMPDDRRAATLKLLQQRFPALEQEEQFRALRQAAAVPAQNADGTSDGQDTRASDLLQESPVSAGGAEPTPAGASPARVAAVVSQGATRSAAEASLARPLQRVDSSTSLLRIFAQTYASESAELRSDEEVEQFLHQLAAVLEAFGKAFLELRRGHDQFGKEVAVPVIGDQTPLRHAKTPRDLFRYLLECNEQAADRIRSLTEGFADVMIHQVALLNGIRQGISALLAHLSPQELLRSSSLSRSGAGSMLLKLRPVRAMALWPPYVNRHQELQEEKAVHSIVFGSEFAFAYAQIVGGNVKSPARKGGPSNGRRSEG